MMATASDLAPAAHRSPRGSSTMDASATAAAASPPAGIQSPQYRRGGGGGVSSPSTQIFRGADSELAISSSLHSSSTAAAVASTVAISVPPSSLSSVSQERIMTSDRSPSKVGASAAASTYFLPEDGAGEAQPESSDNGSGGNNAAKKPAWNKPSNGTTQGGPVMGASWPALSESTRASPKSSSDSLKTLSDVSVPVSQGSGMASPSAHKHGTNTNASFSSTPNHAPYNRQRSIKRGGGNSSSNASVNGGPSQLPPPRASVAETGPNNSGKPANSGLDSSPRDNTHRDGGQRGGVRSQSHSGNEHQQQQNSFRRGSGGPHPHGDGSHHHGYGGRRGDQDRGNQDWNPNRSFGGGRDTHMQPQRVASRPFLRGPPPIAQPFLPPTPMPVRPFGTPIVYPDVPSTVFYLPGPHPESLRAVPMVPPIAPLFFPLPDPHLHTKIVNQIEYYFSNENLIKDTFLRQNMDDQGWVPIKLIASFKKVMQLTDNIQLILDSIRTSSVVEVEGEKVRRRNDWMRWIMPPSVQHSAISSPQSMQKSSQDILAGYFQSIALDDKTAKQGYGETYLSPSSSGEWSSLSQQSSGEKTSQVAVQAGFPTSASNSSK